MKRIYIAAIAALFAATATAQQPAGLERRVEVTKAYAPEISSAMKLFTEPRMEDTVALRPQGTYSIRPAAWQTAFGVKPIAAASIDATPERLQPSLYVKLGGGYPAQSVADIYFHKNFDQGSFGAYINHYGQYADLATDLPKPLDQETTATWSTNRLGLYGAYKTGDKTSVSGEVQYDWNYFTRYGLAVPINANTTLLNLMNPGGPVAQSYSSPRIQAAFGNDFTNLRFLNFKISAGVGYFADRNSNSETDYNVSLALGRMFGANRLTLTAGLHGYTGGGDVLDNYSNTIFNIAPLYSLDNKALKIAFGFDFAIDDAPAGTATRFFPKLSVQWDIARGYFVPFVEVDGQLQNNGMRALATRNPYMLPGSASSVNTARYDVLGGISGSISSAFAYKVYGGATIWRDWCNEIYMYIPGATGAFSPGTQDVLQFTIGGDISGRIAGGFEAILAPKFHIYPDNTSDNKAAGLPDLEADLSARYTWRDRLILQAGITYTGNRYFYAMIPSAQDSTPFVDKKPSPAANLHLTAEYNFKNKIGIFLEAQNLLNAQLYPYNHYQGPGINAMAGVKLRF